MVSKKHVNLLSHFQTEPGGDSTSGNLVIPQMTFTHCMKTKEPKLWFPKKRSLFCAVMCGKVKVKFTQINFQQVQERTKQTSSLAHNKR